MSSKSFTICTEERQFARRVDIYKKKQSYTILNKVGNVGCHPSRSDNDDWKDLRLLGYILKHYLFIYASLFCVCGIYSWCFVGLNDPVARKSNGTIVQNYLIWPLLDLFPSGL